MFINRDYRRTEEDDFKLNVLSRMGLDSEAVPVYGPLDPMKHSASIPVLEEPEPSKGNYVFDSLYLRFPQNNS
jgi:hypothetical protein